MISEFFFIQYIFSYDFTAMSPSNAPTGVTVTMKMFEPSHSDIASAREGRTASAVTQALNMKVSFGDSELRVVYLLSQVLW
jgi:hypothetical protein